MIALAVRYLCKPGEEEAVERALRTMAPLSRAEPGCIAYQIHRDPDNPRVFFLYECWADQAALDAHAAAPHFKEHVLGDAVPRLEERVRTYYEPIEV